MAMKPYVKPRSLKRKPTTEVPTLSEWKRRWEFSHSFPVPMGNPYTHQPFVYAAKQRMYSRTRTRREKYQAITPDITAGDRAPDINRRLITKTLGKGVARLHPIGMAITLASDAKDIYNLLK